MTKPCVGKVGGGYKRGLDVPFSVSFNPSSRPYLLAPASLSSHDCKILRNVLYSFPIFPDLPLPSISFPASYTLPPPHIPLYLSLVMC